MGIKNSRAMVLTEQNREINLARSRILHSTPSLLDPAEAARDDLVRRLQEITSLRRKLMDHVDVEEIWSLMEGEDEGLPVREIAELVFSQEITEDHVASVQRVLLHDRLFFQFKEGMFHARTREKVELRRVEMERAAKRERRLEEGGGWLQAVWQRKPHPPTPEDSEELVEILKDFCLYEAESVHFGFAKDLLKRAGIPAQPASAFRLLVKLGVWREDENLYLHQHGISEDFPAGVLELARERAESFGREGGSFPEGHREDLRELYTATIDSSHTRDYDDALSLRTLASGRWEVGVHIADAAHFVQPGDVLDEEAMNRASSLYLPDVRIPMLPTSLSEDVCSLKVGKDRLALSFFMTVDEEGEVLESRIAPSVVRVREQLTYREVDDRLELEERGERPACFSFLHRLCLRFKEKRMESGAVSLPLPEIQVYVNSMGMIHLSCYEKEAPSQIIVSELMIAANALAAASLAEKGVPAIYRGQGECKPETQPVASEHEIFHVYRRRRLFARAELDTQPRMHCSLGVPSYVSATSPIRRYVDLIIQRQLKDALLGRKPFYGEEQLGQLIMRLDACQSKLSFIHRKWNRYWILKYLEQEDIQALDALVLACNDRFAHLLLPDFLMEANMLVNERGDFKPGEMVRVKVERIQPREDVLRVQV